MGLYSRIAGLLSGPVQWISSVVAPGFSQAAAVSGAGANMTLAPQAATTTGASGSLVVNVAAPASGTAEAGIVFERAGTVLGRLQTIPGATGQIALYGPAATIATPSTTNYGFGFDTNGNGYMNGPTSSNLLAGGNPVLAASASTLTATNGTTLLVTAIKSAGSGTPFQFTNGAVTLTSNSATLTGAQQQTPNLTVAAVTLTGAGLIDFGNVTGNFQLNIVGVNAASFATFGLSLKNGTTTTALPTTALSNGGLVIVRCDPNLLAFCA
jgi:hypothetical protein